MQEVTMPDIVKRVQYFYTEIPDKPGEGAKILTMLQEAGVNLLAHSGFPKGWRAQLDFIPTDVAAFRTAARKGKLTLVGPKTGFLIQGEDRPGALAELIAKLAEATINVTACDAVAAGEGRYGALLWVKPQDVQKAARVLEAVK
jgi:prephenate dehydratase